MFLLNSLNNPTTPWDGDYYTLEMRKLGFRKLHNTVSGLAGIRTQKPHRLHISAECCVRSPEFCSRSSFWGTRLSFSLPLNSFSFLKPHWGIRRYFCEGFCDRIKSILLLRFIYTSIIARFSVWCCISLQIVPARSPETLSLFRIPINPY